jgi:hypothetical protein
MIRGVQTQRCVGCKLRELLWLRSLSIVRGLLVLGSAFWDGFLLALAN